MQRSAGEDSGQVGLGKRDVVPSTLDYPPSFSVLVTVTDVISRRVVVPSVYLSEPGTVEMDRDGRSRRRIANPVDAPLIRQYSRGSIFLAPLELPGFRQAGMVWRGAVIGALVTFLLDGAHDATEGAPGGMIVDLGGRTRRPDEHLQGRGSIRRIFAMGYIPVLGLFLHQGQDVRGQEIGIFRQIREGGYGPSQCDLRG